MKKTIIKQPDELIRWMSKLKSTWAFDCETTSLNWLDLEMIGFSIADGVQACYVVLNPSNKVQMLQILDYYIRESKLIIMANAAYDMMVLKKEGIEV